MRSVRSIEGRVVPLYRADIDTDQIMPKQFLKRIERTGFGAFVFSDWRTDPSFVLNDPAYAGANVLVTGPNFGCGSSREHAPWGLQQYGFEAIVAPSFADIFRNNATKIGLLCVELAPAQCQRLAELAHADPATSVHIDVVAQRLDGGGLSATFPLDPFTKHLLVEGLDDIALTLEHADAVAAYERTRAGWMPSIHGS